MHLPTLKDLYLQYTKLKYKKTENYAGNQMYDSYTSFSVKFWQTKGLFFSYKLNTTASSSLYVTKQSKLAHEYTRIWPDFSQKPEILRNEKEIPVWSGM